MEGGVDSPEGELMVDVGGALGVALGEDVADLPGGVDSGGVTSSGAFFFEAWGMMTWELCWEVQRRVAWARIVWGRQSARLRSFQPVTWSLNAWGRV